MVCRAINHKPIALIIEAIMRNKFPPADPLRLTKIVLTAKMMAKTAVNLSGRSTERIAPAYKMIPTSAEIRSDIVT